MTNNAKGEAVRTLVVVNYLKSDQFVLEGPIKWTISANDTPLIEWEELDLCLTGNDIPSLIKEFAELVLAIREALDLIPEERLTDRDRQLKEKLSGVILRDRKSVV